LRDASPVATSCGSDRKSTISDGRMTGSATGSRLSPLVDELDRRIMNRRDLVVAVAEDAGVERKVADGVLASFVEVVTKQVTKGDPVVISGFAKFARVDRAARMGRNPQTGEPLKIAASRRVRITALKRFKDAVLASKRSR
jgi:DNA-binding protein HU-beta